MDALSKSSNHEIGSCKSPLNTRRVAIFLLPSKPCMTCKAAKMAPAFTSIALTIGWAELVELDEVDSSFEVVSNKLFSIRVWVNSTGCKAINQLTESSVAVWIAKKILSKEPGDCTKIIERIRFSRKRNLELMSMVCW